jgi:hypothetical protein
MPVDFLGSWWRPLIGCALALPLLALGALVAAKTEVRVDPLAQQRPGAQGTAKASRRDPLQDEPRERMSTQRRAAFERSEQARNERLQQMRQGTYRTATPEPPRQHPLGWSPHPRTPMGREHWWRAGHPWCRHSPMTRVHTGISSRDSDLSGSFLGR